MPTTNNHTTSPSNQPRVKRVVFRLWRDQGVDTELCSVAEGSLREMMSLKIKLSKRKDGCRYWYAPAGKVTV